MTHYILDTNYLLRYLLNDVPSQADKVQKYIEKAKKEEIGLFVPIYVVIELEYALTHHYLYSRDIASELLIKLSTYNFINFDQRNTLINSFKIYQENVSLSFLDALLYLDSKTRGYELLTFDKKLKNLVV